MKITEFDWDHQNIVHMGRHHIVFQEVVEIVFDSPRYLKTKQGRFIVMGITRAGRYLFAVFVKKRERAVRVITARDMTKTEKQYYRKRT